jgi:hydrogenase maturation protease
MKTLVLGLGNDLFSDDGVGILAARALKENLIGMADVVESSLSGLALLDILMGYERAIVIDAIRTTLQPPGTISELTPADFDAAYAPSPHYTGLPELLAIADQMDLDFPKDIRIFAVEVMDTHTVGGDLTEPVEKALPLLIERVQAHVEACCGQFAHT